MNQHPDIRPPKGEPADHYKNLVDLLAVRSAAESTLAEWEANMHQAYVDLVDAGRKEYVDLQKTIAAADAAIEATALLNPQWFEAERTVKTPYGSVAKRRVTKLVVENEEVTVALLEQRGPEAEAFLRVRKQVNVEALETMGDEELRRIRVRRVQSESIAIRCTKPDFGKAAKKAEKGKQPEESPAG
jgi:hypothetical protein